MNIFRRASSFRSFSTVTPPPPPPSFSSSPLKSKGKVVSFNFFTNVGLIYDFQLKELVTINSSSISAECESKKFLEANERVEYNYLRIGTDLIAYNLYPSSGFSLVCQGKEKDGKILPHSNEERDKIINYNEYYNEKKSNIENEKLFLLNFSLLKTKKNIKKLLNNNKNNQNLLIQKNNQNNIINYQHSNNNNNLLHNFTLEDDLDFVFLDDSNITSDQFHRVSHMGYDSIVEHLDCPSINLNDNNHLNNKNSLLEDNNFDIKNSLTSTSFSSISSSSSSSSNNNIKKKSLSDEIEKIFTNSSPNTSNLLDNKDSKSLFFW